MCAKTDLLNLVLQLKYKNTNCMASSQFDKIWCLEYDQDSYHRPMVKINFSKYLNTILSNQYFPAFQIQLHKELNNQFQWNERSWAIIQMFEYINKAFAIKQFQSNVKFIADKKTRKTFGSFRMWIDLQRLYLMSFLKMDRIQFQEDRIFFSLYRTMYFLYDLLSQYQLLDFKLQFLNRVSNQIKEHTKVLQKCLPAYMHIMLKSIRQMIPNFIKKVALADYKQKDDVKKMTFRKLTRQYEMMPQIEQRLQNNVQFQLRLAQMKDITFIGQSADVEKLTKQIEQVYNPRLRIIQGLKKDDEANNKPFDEAKIQELYKKDQNKQKQKVAIQNPYQSLMRTGHNPYDESNYAIYGQTLGIDMKQKENLQKFQEQEEVQEQPVKENELIKDPLYIEKAQKIQISSVAVTNKDLNNRATITKNRDNHYSQDNSTLLRNLKWKQQNNQKNIQNEVSDEDNESQDDKKNAPTTLRSINLRKNLQNNALFQKHDEQKQKNLGLFENLFKKGFDSKVLQKLEKKTQIAFDEMQQVKLVSIKNKATLDRSKFDTLRKVAQLHAINKKINKWIGIGKVPILYPRGNEQIRKYYVDTNIEITKKQLAFQPIYQT